MSTLVIYDENPNIVRLSGLHAPKSPATFISDATVTCTVTDAAGTEITGETWPLSMPYIAASDGIYEAELLPALPWIVGTEFLIVIEAVEGLRTSKWTIPVRPIRRDAA